MRLPQTSSHFSHRVRYGRYVARRLRQAKLASLATDIENATSLLREKGRELEDAQDPIQDAMADRDGFDADIDFVAQSARNELAGRSLDAIRSEPYKSIFNQGIAYYIAAPLGEENARYQELTKRLEANLPAGDSVRVSTVKAIMEGLEGFNTAVRALDDARARASMLATSLSAATEAWERQVEKTYGALVVELGRPRAEGFFPRVGSRKSPGTGTQEPLVPEPTD
jgi:hypothetical protein